jgi:hypothetical protein
LKFACTLLSLLLVCANASGAKDPRIDSAYLIKAEILGAWNEAGKSGLLRYSIYQGGVEEVETVLLLEWIKTDDETDTQTIISQQEISPIPGVFDAPKLISDKPYTLQIDIRTNLCDEPQSYDVVITGVGKYKLKRLNKEACDMTGPSN